MTPEERAEADRKIVARAKPLTLNLPGQEPQTYVPAAEYLRVVQQHADYSRALSLVAAARLPGGEWINVDAVLADVGLTPEVVRSVLSITQRVRDGTLRG